MTRILEKHCRRSAKTIAQQLPIVWYNGRKNQPVRVPRPADSRGRQPIEMSRSSPLNTTLNRLTLLLVMVAAIGFHGVQDAAWAASRDTDGDGWFDAKKNQRVTLTLVGLTSNKGGDYRVVVDNVCFPHTEKNLQAVVHAEPATTRPLDFAVARRALGARLSRVGHRLPTWQTKVALAGSDTSVGTGATVVTWSSKTGQSQATVAVGPDEEVKLDFRTSVELFADPSPNDRNGDADRDGILDWEESFYASQGIDLGDPTRRDLVLVVGHTHAAWKMTDQTRRLLRTRFFQQGINLHIMADPDESMNVCRPGLMKLKEKPLPRDHALSLKEARQMRETYLSKPMLRHAHLVVLSANVSPNPATAWGYADLPGSTLVVRSHLPLLGPDFHQYQAKTLMHELGHNLGLCHPEQSGPRCISGPIPVAERHPGLTVMGTPRADRGNPLGVLKHAWSRPLDYSPTQWKNARLDWVRPENRPARAGRKKR
ncbi:MAG: hypothetical protein JW888_08715 [Pirellulales bacterium]|nr:hypothetical protein [Pirellulales bacterium]